MSAPGPRPASTSCCGIEGALSGDLRGMIRRREKQQGAGMDWTTLLFSFHGRLNRGKYWLAVLIYVAVWTSFVAGPLICLGGFDTDNLLSFAGAGRMIGFVGFLVFAFRAWSCLAIGVTRLPDRVTTG